MSNTHTGNLQPALDYEEHLSIGGVNAKAVMVFDNAGNQITSFGGGSGNATVDIRNTINANVSLGASAAFIGLVTVANTVPVTFSGNVTLDVGSKTQIAGNVTLSDPKTFIGLTTTTLGASPAFIGLVTVANTVSTTFSGNVTLDDGSLTGIVGNVTLSDAKTFIGLTTTTLGASSAFVGLVTVANTVPTTFSGNVTLDDGSLTGIVGNVTLSDSKGFIGLVSVSGFANPLPVTFSGNVTLSPSVNWVGFATVAIGSGGAGDGAILDGVDATIKASVASVADGRYLHVGIRSNSTVLLGNMPALTTGVAYVGLATIDIGSNNNVAIKGNVTLSDPKGFIGLATVQVGTIAAGANYIGLASVNIGGTLPALSAGAAYVGLVTVANTVPVTFSGNVTLDDGSLTGLIAGANYIGLATIDIGTNNNVAIKGNVTLSDSKAFIGLATIVPTFIAGYTSFSTVISALATIVVPPSGQKIFVRNLHVSSLGRAELSLWSVNATATVNRLPWTSLSTTSGMAPYYGENGMQWAAANDGLTIALNGGATVGIMVDCRFSA